MYLPQIWTWFCVAICYDETRKTRKEGKVYGMGIQMIGIDHSNAEIDVRTIFSFTKAKAVDCLLYTSDAADE